jgi:hypothetical protein
MLIIDPSNKRTTQSGNIMVNYAEHRQHPRRSCLRRYGDCNSKRFAREQD